jgi:hypothetical protein
MARGGVGVVQGKGKSKNKGKDGAVAAARQPG